MSIAEKMQESSEWWETQLSVIGGILIEMYQKGSNIFRFQTTKTVLGDYYGILVRKKEIPPIESLEKSEKERIWKIALASGFEKLEDRVRVSKAVYCVERILGTEVLFRDEAALATLRSSSSNAIEQTKNL